MPIDYNQTTINGRLNVVLSNIDAGPGVGQMRLLTGAPIQTVALIPLQKPSGTVSGGVLTFVGLPSVSSIIATGTINTADIEDSTGIVVASGLTVSTSTASDIMMVDTAVVAGDLVTLTFATITGV